MLSPGTLNLVAYQRATFDRVLTWKIDGIPVNLTGYTAHMQVRQALGAPVEVEASTTAGGIALGGTSGTITVQLTDAQTAALAPGKYIYDLILDSGAEVTRLVQGSLTVEAGVTQ